MAIRRTTVGGRGEARERSLEEQQESAALRSRDEHRSCERSFANSNEEKQVLIAFYVLCWMPISTWNALTALTEWRPLDRPWRAVMYAMHMAPYINAALNALGTPLGLAHHTGQSSPVYALCTAQFKRHMGDWWGATSTSRTSTRTALRSRANCQSAAARLGEVDDLRVSQKATVVLTPIVDADVGVYL